MYPLTYELKKVATYCDGTRLVSIVEDGQDPSYLEKRAATLTAQNNDPSVEYRVIARY